MSITPIEMYTMVPKSQEASNLRHGELAKDASQQAGMLRQFGQDINANSQRTVRSKESDDPEYRYDNKDGSSNGKGYDASGRRKGRSNEQQKDKKDKPGYSGSGGFDIRI